MLAITLDWQLSRVSRISREQETNLRKSDVRESAQTWPEIGNVLQNFALSDLFPFFISGIILQKMRCFPRIPVGNEKCGNLASLNQGFTNSPISVNYWATYLLGYTH